MANESVGRNDPCPCGSGAKYKKCCLEKDEAARPREAPAAARASGPAELSGEPFAGPWDEWSNGALEAIEAGRYEEAEKLCERLLREYPELTDGEERLGMLREAQGRHAEAAEAYAKALEVIAKDPGGFPTEMVDEIRSARDEALRKAAAK